MADVVTEDPAIALLRELVAIDSVNPTLVPGAPGEAHVARCLAEALHAIGLTTEIQEAAPGRPNVVGVLEGRRPGRALMLCGHIDTVGVAGMSRPFAPDVRDGRMYGRGALDMKGGVAAMVDAARVLAESGGLDSGRVIVAAVVDEEHGSIGAEALVTRWRADGAVVTEPTNLDVAVAHKGFAWVAVETRGRAAHGSRPAEGRDAILRMGRVLSRLEALGRRLEQGPPHPLLGTASLHASMIEGGSEMSTYPARARLQLERRTLPGEPSRVALDEVVAILDDLRREDPELEADAAATFAREGYVVDPASALPSLIGDAARSMGCPARQVGASFWTDAAILAAAGIPSVIFGPGGEALHGPGEYVVLDDVLRCRDTLVSLARRFTALV
jgi:acetylornithine deacetylase